MEKAGTEKAGGEHAPQGGGGLEHDAGYVVAVADSLVFSLLDDEWMRLRTFDSHIRQTSLRSALTALAVLGVHPSFGDGELPAVPPNGMPHVAALRELLRRIREIAPHALAGGADTFTRILCTERFPRIYTTAVLDLWPTTPVHVVQASDLAFHPAEWLRVGELARFTGVRSLMMFGSPLGRWPMPLDLSSFTRLRALDLSRSQLRSLPPTLERVASLEALELAENPIAADMLDVLEALPGLRYLGLRGTEVTADDVEVLRAHLPSRCEIAV